MTFPSLQEHFDAVEALLTAANAVPTDLDQAPTTDCNQFTVADRFGGVRRMTGQIGTRSVRVVVKALGQTADNAREMQRLHDAALRGVRVTVGAYRSTPIQFESGDAVAPDGDLLTTGAWFSASSTYTFTV
ncbi:hypothetical protein [Nocardioides sp. YIM 152315]|uniref:hypothetical protein n=1 Tax=Nocardioides sp. YIM 152315 TaxID=3031760 RepID=UPI0023DBD408|nr:hypothetical protein [Nocardioides sp. YIM 152315]MDF1603397.1 hypothetical protein [Nocardioides sp. YIM 152315]